MEWITKVDEIEVNGIYRLGINNGIVVMLVCSSDEKPHAMVGSNHMVFIDWREEVGTCPWLDTYTIANCQLLSNVPTKVTLVRLYSVQR